MRYLGISSSTIPGFPSYANARRDGPPGAYDPVAGSQPYPN